MPYKNVSFISALSLMNLLLTFFYVQNFADLVANKSNYAGALLLPFIFCPCINVLVVKLAARRVDINFSVFTAIALPVVVLLISYFIFYWMVMNLPH